MYCPQICIEGAEEYEIPQDGPSFGRYLNSGLPIYEAGVLIILPRLSVIYCYWSSKCFMQQVCSIFSNDFPTSQFNFSVQEHTNCIWMRCTGNFLCSTSGDVGRNERVTCTRGLFYASTLASQGPKATQGIHLRVQAYPHWDRLFSLLLDFPKQEQLQRCMLHIAWIICPRPQTRQFIITPSGGSWLISK